MCTRSLLFLFFEPHITHMCVVCVCAFEKIEIFRNKRKKIIWTSLCLSMRTEYDHTIQTKSTSQLTICVMCAHILFWQLAFQLAAVCHSNFLHSFFSRAFIFKLFLLIQFIWQCERFSERASKSKRLYANECVFDARIERSIGNIICHSSTTTHTHTHNKLCTAGWLENNEALYRGDEKPKWFFLLLLLLQIK